MQPLLKIENLKVQFDTDIQRINAVNHVSLHVNRGEIVGIIGASGSGKSTLAKSVLGLLSNDQVTEGKLTLNTNDEIQDLNNLNQEEWLSVRGKQVTMVFQNPLLNLNPSLSIARHFSNITDSQSSVEDTLDQVGLSETSAAILSAYPHQLSGGQQQRILIALAMIQEVDLLLLDEPMASLDSENQDAIEVILKSMVDKGMAMIFITHDLNVISRLAHRIYVLDGGEVVEEGQATDIINQPKHDYTRALVQAANLDERPISPDKGSLILKVERVSHVYKKGGFLSWNPKKVQALTEVSLAIEKGHIVGLVGPSGSGKSTLVKILLGIESLQSGSIELDDRSIESYVAAELRKRIQMIPQNTADALNPKMILADQLRDVFRKHCEPSADFQAVIHSLLSDIELSPDLLGRFPSELSGGEIQRMAIVRALIIRPQILVLDESLSALDMLIQRKTLDLLHLLNEKLGMTIVLISHDARLIRHSCDRVFHFDGGKMKSL